MKEIYGGLPVHDYTTKFSVSIVYAILVSTAMGFFYRPGNIYSSGLTNLVQILTTLSTKVVGFNVPVSATLYPLNVPLFFTAWKKTSKELTTFIFIIVTLTSLFIHTAPQTVMTQDPIICAIFGEAISGSGIGFVLKSGVFFGSLSILGIIIQKKTGRSAGSVSIYFNALAVFVISYLSGWQYMFYSALLILVSGKVAGVIYTKQKKTQVTIVTRNPDRVVDEIQRKVRRGITIIHEAEGVYRHDRQAVPPTIATRFGLPSLGAAMKEGDPNAFVSISDNVKILRRFHEEDYK